jgi:serine/threonine-protein kinase RsbW
MSSEAAGDAVDQPGQITNSFEVRLPGEVRAISAAADSISDKLRQLPIPEEKQMEIILAVQEALANAVVHGCKNDPAKEVCCRLEQYANGHILIAVRDSGPGYSPQHVPDPMQADHIYEDHGRGIYIIRQLMDKVSFEHNGSEIRMWKY